MKYLGLTLVTCRVCQKEVKWNMDDSTGLWYMFKQCHLDVFALLLTFRENIGKLSKAIVSLK